MDDTPDKLRRNVVTFSALIIGAWFLRIELATQPKILGIELSKLDPVRFWICVTSALVYMVLRFHFAAETRSLLTAMRTEYTNFGSILLRRMLAKEMEGFLLSGQKCTMVLYPENYVQRLAGPPDNLRAKLAKAEITAQEVPSKSAWWEGTATLSTRRTWSGGTYWAETPDCECRYRVNIRARAKLRVFAAARLALYSKSGVDALIPYLLAAAALSVCIVKLLAAV